MKRTFLLILICASLNTVAQAARKSVTEKKLLADMQGEWISDELHSIQVTGNSIYIEYQGKDHEECGLAEFYLSKDTLKLVDNEKYSYYESARNSMRPEFYYRVRIQKDTLFIYDCYTPSWLQSHIKRYYRRSAVQPAARPDSVFISMRYVKLKITSDSIYYKLFNGQIYTEARKVDFDTAFALLGFLKESSRALRCRPGEEFSGFNIRIHRSGTPLWMETGSRYSCHIYKLLSIKARLYEQYRNRYGIFVDTFFTNRQFLHVPYQSAYYPMHNFISGTIISIDNIDSNRLLLSIGIDTIFHLDYKGDFIERSLAFFEVIKDTGQNYQPSVKGVFFLQERYAHAWKGDKYYNFYDKNYLTLYSWCRIYSQLPLELLIDTFRYSPNYFIKRINRNGLKYRLQQFISYHRSDHSNYTRLKRSLRRSKKKVKQR